MLTKDEVNEALALLDEWVYADDPLGPKDSGQKRWQKHGGILNLIIKDPPDYCSNWNHLGPLLMKMVKAGSVDLDSNKSGQYVATSKARSNKDMLGASSWGDTLTEAIAREVLAWMEGNG